MANCSICGKSTFSIGLCKDCKAALMRVQMYKPDSQEFKEAKTRLEPYLKDDDLYNADKKAAKQAIEEQEAKSRAKAALEEQGVNADNILQLVTTSDTIPGCRIISQKGLVSGFSAVGTGTFSEFKSGHSDMLGSSSGALSEKMKSAFIGAVSQMYQEAAAKGCNAVIATRIANFSLANNMICAAVCGTAVNIEKANDQL